MTHGFLSQAWETGSALQDRQIPVTIPSPEERVADHLSGDLKIESTVLDTVVQRITRRDVAPVWDACVEVAGSQGAWRLLRDILYK